MVHDAYPSPGLSQSDLCAGGERWWPAFLAGCSLYPAARTRAEPLNRVRSAREQLTAKVRGKDRSQVFNMTGEVHVVDDSSRGVAAPSRVSQTWRQGRWFRRAELQRRGDEGDATTGVRRCARRISIPPSVSLPRGSQAFIDEAAQNARQGRYRLQHRVENPCTVRSRISDDQFRQDSADNIIADDWLIYLHRAADDRHAKDSSIIVVSSVGRTTSCPPSAPTASRRRRSAAHPSRGEYRQHNMRVNCVAPRPDQPIRRALSNNPDTLKTTNTLADAAPSIKPTRSPAAPCSSPRRPARSSSTGVHHRQRRHDGLAPCADLEQPSSALRHPRLHNHRDARHE